MGLNYQLKMSYNPTYQYDPKVLGVPKISEGNTAEYNLDKK